MNRTFKTLACTGAVALLAWSQAFGLATLRLTDLSTASTVTIADGMLGLDLNGAPGAVTFSGVVGNWDINVTTGLTKPTSGSATQPFLDLNSIDAITINPIPVGGATLMIEFSESGFGPLGPVSGKASIGGTLAPGATISFSTYQGLPTGPEPAGALFAQNSLITSQGPFGPGPGAFGGNASGPVPGGAAYSLTLVVNLTHVPASGDVSSSFNGSLSVVPDAGSTLMLLGSALAGLGLFARSRKHKA